MANPETAAQTSSRRRRSRRRVRPITPLRERVGAVLLAVAVVGSALAFGAQHPPVLVLVALSAAGAALSFGTRRTSAPVWLLVGLAAYTALQAVPLPAAWVARLSPGSAEVWSGALRPFHERGPAWVTLSVDPAATVLEVLKWTAYACLLIAASAWRARRRAETLALLVFGSGVLVALVTLAHGLVDASRIYGRFLLNGNLRWARGPFVNPNNLAGYLDLAFFAGAGLWLSNRGGRVGRFLPVGLVVLAVGAVLTGSRGGVGVLVLGSVALGALLIRQRRDDWPRFVLGLGGVVLLCVAAGVALGGKALESDLLDRDTSGKFAAWRWSAGLVRDFPVFGVGRGAFETAFQPYRQSLGRDWTLIFSHPENFPIQWVADWGLPVGLAVLVGLAWAARGLFARALREPLPAGLVVGLGGLFVQNLVDVGLEIFGVTAAALVVFAAARPAERVENVWSPKRCVSLALAVALTSVVVVATGAAPVKLERDHIARAYADFSRSRARDGAPLRAELREAMLRHPGEPYFPLVGALLARATRKGDPLAWLERALERGPINGNVHLVLAQVLAERGARKQAFLHLRYTAVYDRTLQDAAYARAVSWARSADELASIFPRELPGSELLAELCEHVRGEPIVGCWREVHRRMPGASSSTRLVGALLDALEGARPPCGAGAAAACRDEARGLLAGLEKQPSGDFQPAYYRVRLLALEGQPERAVEAGLEGCPAITEAEDCARQVFELAFRTRQPKLMERAAHRLTAVRCTESERCAEANSSVAEAYARLSTYGIALRYFSEAAKVQPNAERWIRVADAAARAGSGITARASLERAGRAEELTADQRTRMAAVEALLQGDTGRLTPPSP